jgi:hypothetical protein
MSFSYYLFLISQKKLKKFDLFSDFIKVEDFSDIPTIQKSRITYEGFDADKHVFFLIS